MGRPTFHQAVDLLAAYMSKVERQTYESRARLDSGVGDCEGYLDMTSTRLSTPSTSGTASKCSTRSRTVSKSSASSYIPSSSTASPSTNYSTSSRAGRAIYWSNYKIINNSNGQSSNLPEMMTLSSGTREGELPLISIASGPLQPRMAMAGGRREKRPAAASCSASARASWTCVADPPSSPAADQKSALPATIALSSDDQCDNKAQQCKLIKV